MNSISLVSKCAAVLLILIVLNACASEAIPVPVSSTAAPTEVSAAVVVERESTPTPLAAESENEIVPGCLVISFAPDIVGSDGAITPEEIANGFGVEVREVERLVPDAEPGQTTGTAFDGTPVELYDWSRVFLLKFDESVPVESVQNRFEPYVGGLVDFVHPDEYGVNDDEPDDPRRGDQWHLDKINAPLAWDIASGANVVIAVIEIDGVDTTHEDLTNQVGAGGDAATKGEHGTAVAGVAVAETDNATGIAGVAPAAQLIPFTGATVANRVADVLKVVRQSQKKENAGVRYVVNMSWHIDKARKALENALRDAHAVGIVLVASAGNNQKPIPYDAWPAKYDDYVIAVGGTEKNDTRRPTSNYGDWLDVVAPGADILTTDLSGDNYGTHSGTSFAAPQVAGVAALVLSQNPRLTPSEVQRRIEDSARQVGGYAYDVEDTNEEMGHGRIDAYGALLMDASPVSVELVDKTLEISSPDRANHYYWVSAARTIASGGERGQFRDLQVNLAGEMNLLGSGKLDSSGGASVKIPDGTSGYVQVIVCPSDTTCRDGAVSTVLYIEVPLAGAAKTAAAPAELPNLNGRVLLVGADPAIYPFAFFDEQANEASGFEVDLLKEICRVLNCQIEVSFAPRAELLVALAQGQFDLSASGWIVTAESEAAADMGKPYWHDGEAILVRADDDRIAGKEDLVSGEFVVGVQRNTLSEASAQSLVPSAQLYVYDTLDAAVTALLAGEIDAVVTKRILADLRSLRYPGQLKIVGEPFDGVDLAFAFREGDNELLPAFNAALEVLEQNGDIERLYEKWFGSPQEN